jgi:hypothetical protein
VENKKLIEATVDGKPLEDERVYSGASNSYFAGRALKDLGVTDSGKPRLQILTDYIRKKGTIHPAYDGRRVVVGH